MKHYLLIVITLLFAFTALSIAHSVPMNGTYGIGSGGDYTSINQAVSDVTTRGVSGPVTFRILTGNYNEFVTIPGIPGVSLANSITFESFAGNADSVKIFATPYTLTFDSASFITFRNLNIAGHTEFRRTCDHIEILNNKFSNWDIYQSSGNVSNLKISGNTELLGILLAANNLNVNVIIENNICVSPDGFIELQKMRNLIVDHNVTNTLLVNNSRFVKLSRNQTTLHTVSDAGFVLNFNDTIQVINNFTVDQTFKYDVYFRGNRSLSVINNTFRSESDSNEVTIELLDNTNMVFKNNIVTNMNGKYVMQLTNNPGLNSNFNVYWNTTTPSEFIKFNGDDFADLIAYAFFTGNDLQSVVREPYFTSPDDLHLAGASISDVLLVGSPDPLVINDIDGQPRSSIYPYRGADEADIPLPVELSSFTYAVNNNDITLNWSTSSELNNAGFDIERAEVKNNSVQQWNRVGCVNGNGTQTSVHNYTFTDHGLSTGHYNYRLKQTDFNGNFAYHNLSSEVNVGIPVMYSLSQNYPNPFNPSTSISYEIPFDGKVSLKIFDISGKEVEALVNEVKTAGYYSINFNASNLSSGVYFYSLSANNFTATKKLTLLK